MQPSTLRLTSYYIIRPASFVMNDMHWYLVAVVLVRCLRCVNRYGDVRVIGTELHLQGSRKQQEKIRYIVEPVSSWWYRSSFLDLRTLVGAVYPHDSKLDACLLLNKGTQNIPLQRISRTAVTNAVQYPTKRRLTQTLETVLAHPRLIVVVLHHRILENNMLVVLYVFPYLIVLLTLRPESGRSQHV